MELKKVVGIAVAALLAVGLVFWLGHHLGASSDSTAKLEELRAENNRLKNELKDAAKKRVEDLDQREDEHKKLEADLKAGHIKEIADKNTEIERRENEYRRVLGEKDSTIKGLNETITNLEGLYRTRTVVCIGLGAAVVGALFVGTLMGAKGRRDAMRARKEHNTPTEEVV